MLGGVIASGTIPDAACFGTSTVWIGVREEGGDDVQVTIWEDAEFPRAASFPSKSRDGKAQEEEEAELVEACYVSAIGMC